MIYTPNWLADYWSRDMTPYQDLDKVIMIKNKINFTVEKHFELKKNVIDLWKRYWFANKSPMCLLQSDWLIDPIQ